MSTTELTVESLDARMKRQAQSVQVLWAAVAVLAIFVVAYTEMRRPDTIHARTLDAATVIAGTVAVKNGTGDIVASLSASADGSPQFSLYDRQKKLRMSISLAADGAPSLSLLDPGAVHRAVLSLNDRQQPSLVFYEPSRPNDEKGPQRVLLTVDTSASGYLALFGRAGALNLATADGRMKWTPVAGTAQDLPLQK